MKFPIGNAFGETTVNELIAALLEFPPASTVALHWNQMEEKATLEVETETTEIVILE